MCNPASMILTQDRVYWSMRTDSHAEIIQEFGLVEWSDVRGEPLILKVEVTPPNNDMRKASSEWVYRVDQDIMPRWLAGNEEDRSRVALAEWITARVFVDRSAGRVMDASIWLLGSSSAELYDSSSAKLYDSSRAVLYDSSSAVLLGSSSAVLYDSSRAVLYDSSSAKLYDSSRAKLWGSSSAKLYDSSSAKLWGSSRAELWGSSSAVLYDSSSAKLYDSSRAKLYDSSRAVLYDSSIAEFHTPFETTISDSAVAICRFGKLRTALGNGTQRKIRRK